MPNTKSKILALIVITCYLALLAPDIILSNTGESGIIIESQSVQHQSIPRDIQDLLPPRDNYHITIINDPSSEEQCAVISGRTWYVEGVFVKVIDETNEWYTDSRTFSSIVNQPFDKIVVGETEEVAVEWQVIETITRLDMGGDIIFILSSIDALVGGFFLILILSVLLKGSVALWNIPGIASCYSFQALWASIVALLNQTDIDETQMILGTLFVVLIPLTIWLQRYEETEEGEQKIYELYMKNKKIVSGIKNKFGM
jgi:hypothetical protein